MRTFCLLCCCLLPFVSVAQQQAYTPDDYRRLRDSVALVPRLRQALADANRVLKVKQQQLEAGQYKLEEALLAASQYRRCLSNEMGITQDLERDVKELRLALEKDRTQLYYYHRLATPPKSKRR